MARAKPAYTPNPRMLNIYQLAARLGMSESTFARKLPILEAKGFPRRNDLIGGWDGDAIELWLDVQSGIGSTADDDKLMGTIYDRY